MSNQLRNSVGMVLVILGFILLVLGVMGFVADIAGVDPIPVAPPSTTLLISEAVSGTVLGVIGLILL